MSEPKPISDEDLSFDVLWEADNWECTHTSREDLEDDLANGEAFEVVRIGVARRARDIFAVPYWNDEHDGTHYAYFESEDEAKVFAKAKQAAYREEEAKTP